MRLLEPIQLLALLGKVLFGFGELCGKLLVFRFRGIKGLRLLVVVSLKILDALVALRERCRLRGVVLGQRGLVALLHGGEIGLVLGAHLGQLLVLRRLKA